MRKASPNRSDTPDTVFTMTRTSATRSQIVDVLTEDVTLGRGSRSSPFRTKREIAAAMLRTMIITGEMGPGTRLILVQLADELNLSLTPVREAIQQLESEGFVEVVNHKGGVVVDLDRDKLQELYAMRAGIEGMVARIGTKEITDEGIEEMAAALAELQSCQGDLEEQIALDMAFHTVLFAAAGREGWLRTIRQLWQQSVRYRLASSASLGYEKLDQDHRALLKAVRDRDAAKAEEITHRHLARARDELLRGGSFRKD
jgi:DNA-binding GntR family transcriptional regulator